MKTDVSVIINSDIILLPDFVEALKKVRSEFSNFLFIGARWDVDQLEVDIGSPGYGDILGRYAKMEGMLHTYGGEDYFAFPPGGNPYTRVIGKMIPPFSYGRSKGDNWIVHHAAMNPDIRVIDGSEAVHALHIAHTRDHLRATPADNKQNFWSANRDLPEPRFNRHLAYYYGNYTNTQGTTLAAEYKLTNCIQNRNERMCMQQRVRPNLCPCEHSSFARKTQTDPAMKGDYMVCGTAGLDKKEDFAMVIIFKK
jgi:hypothetical protein